MRLTLPQVHAISTVATEVEMNTFLKILFGFLLLFGSKNSQIATLFERHSRYVLLARVKSKDTETVINALIKQAHKLPRELYRLLSWDRGSEMADHKRFTLDTDIRVYICDP